MTYLIIVVTVTVVLLAWSALATCSLDSFRPDSTLHSQMTGPEAHQRLVETLLELPGIRSIEHDERGVLLSVLPTITSMERGWGAFLLVRRTDDGVVLLAQRRIPLPSTKLGATLRQIERDARMRAMPRRSG